MKIKITDLITSNAVLNELFSQKMNGAVAFKVSEIIQEMEYRLKTFEEVRTKLVTDNGGVYDEGKKKYNFENDETEEKVNKEFEELIQQEVEIHARPLTLTDLDKIPEAQPLQMRVLRWAIE